ncbi:hypothetical protein ACWEO1_19170 [Kitasatospora cineracea]
MTWASGLGRKAAVRWAGRLQVLGIADIDWRAGRWTARACEVTTLPGRINTALVIGARPAELAFYQQQGSVVLKQPGERFQMTLPSAVWSQVSGLVQLEAFAAAVCAAVVPCAAESLSKSLQPFRLGPEAPPPARHSDVELLDPASGRFRAADLSRGLPRAGLYKYTVYGRLDRYALFERGCWHAADRREGIHHVLPPSAFPLRWKDDSGSRQPRGFHLGQLLVDSRASLPRRQEEAAVMCTGLPPIAVNGGQRYDGVPLRIADRISRSLHRVLEIE